MGERKRIPGAHLNEDEYPVASRPEIIRAKQRDSVRKVKDVLDQGEPPTKEMAESFDLSNEKAEELMKNPTVEESTQSDALREDEYRNKRGNRVEVIKSEITDSDQNEELAKTGYSNTMDQHKRVKEQRRKDVDQINEALRKVNES